MIKNKKQDYDLSIYLSIILFIEKSIYGLNPFHNCIILINYQKTSTS